MAATMATTAVTLRGGARSSAPRGARAPRAAAVRCAGAPQPDNKGAARSSAPGAPARRDMLLALGVAAPVLQLGQQLAMPLPAFADDEEAFKIYYGAANPPATYGGVGGTTKDKARYSFVHPESWTEDAISKVEKGANGTDSRFSSAKAKKEQAYVVSLVNEGGRTLFKQNDPEKALESISSSDAILQDSIVYGDVNISTRKSDNGETFFDYEIIASQCYLISLTSRQGRIFALFLNGPQRNFTKDRAMFDKMQASFATYEVDIYES